ncbi:MAG TPA: 4-hydroxybenzoate octaprenyltransferase [Rhizomicrobium sp.]|jgi:4-hydroxybenzoate polyprenyltransferase
MTPLSEAQRAIPADAIPRSWVDRVPLSLQPWLRLMRLDRPIGVELLFLPCVFGLALGANAQARGFGSLHDLWLLVLFAIGAIVMRGAGCTYNDIVDRDIDAKVARTRGRPIPSGAVSIKAAWLFTALQCAAGLAVLLQLNIFSMALGASSLVLVALYPFMKRITWWPQAWLGLTFNWGALLGFSAQAATLTLPAFLLYAGCFFWTLGYDTIYAHQDKEDDALIGVKSTARLLGENSPRWIDGFYSLSLGLLVLTLVVTTGRLWSALLLLPAGLHFIWQTRRLDVNDSALCLRRFRANRDAGLLIAAAFILASYIH